MKTKADIATVEGYTATLSPLPSTPRTAHLGGDAGGTGKSNDAQNKPDHALSSRGDPVKERTVKRSWLLSGIIPVNVLILGCALVSGSAFNNVKINSIDLQIYLIILVILTTVWMLYYTIYTSREDCAVLYKDSHAGPVWLRGGLVLFAICSLLMDVFKIANYIGYLHCDSAVKIVFPALQIIFILVQTYFLWLHAKDCVQLQRNITRCGLMLTLSTNLMLWMAAVTDESLHQTVVPPEVENNTRSYLSLRASGGDNSCICSHSACSIFEQAYYYLYPFNIEYSLFASAMAYVMWKNVGRQADEHNHHTLHFHLKDVMFGPVVGLVMLIAGLGTFIIYEVDVKGDQSTRDTALMLHYIMNMVAVVLMSIVTLAGCAIYRLDRRDHVLEKNPTRSLDVGLLIGASIGQFTICYFTIVAVVATGAKGHLNALNLVVSLVTIIQLCLQNMFIIEGLHREPFHDDDSHQASVFTNPYVLQAHRDKLSGKLVECKSSPALAVRSMHIAPLAPSTHTPSHRHGLTWKRRALKEVCVFLLLCNILLWIMPAFGARPQFDNTIGVEFYEFTLWAAVVNIGLPFGIFYRMHSVASLFEVFLTT